MKINWLYFIINHFEDSYLDMGMGGGDRFRAVLGAFIEYMSVLRGKGFQSTRLQLPN